MIPDGFRCASCGQWHDGLPLSYGSDRPAEWYDVPADRIEADVLLSSDQCVIADRFYFIRGVLEIPVIGTGETFGWGVWVSLSEDNFDKQHEMWNIEGRETQLPPMFGWLSTELPVYPSTLHLKTNLHTRPVGVRPLIEVEATDHPLSVEQRNGMTLERVKQIASELMHYDDDRRPT